MFTCKPITQTAKLVKIATAALLITAPASFAIGLGGPTLPNLQFPEPGAFGSASEKSACLPKRCPQPEATKDVTIKK